MSLNLLLFCSTLLIYLLATVLYLYNVAGHSPKTTIFTRLTLLAGFALHSATLVADYVNLGFTPVTNLQESLSFFVWTLIGVLLIIELRYRLAILGTFATGMAVLFMTVGVMVPPADAQHLAPVLDHWLFPLHVSLAFLGNAVFAMAFGAGLMYLVQERLLKEKTFNRLYHRLPSLETLDQMNAHCLVFGFPLLTLGLISGTVWANIAWGSYWSWDPKQIWGVITWFLYAILLHGRLAVGWRGRRTALFAIVGFLCLLFSFLGVNLLMEGAHTFDTFSGN